MSGLTRRFRGSGALSRRSFNAGTTMMGAKPLGARMQIAKAEPQSKRLRKQAGVWLKDLRAKAGLSQIELAAQLGFKYYTFISQVENGFGRVPTESMEAWGR